MKFKLIYYLTFIMPIIMLLSCDKEYDLFGKSEEEEVVNNCIIEKINIADFFSNASIVNFDFDSDNILWIGTTQGLLNINGDNHTVYNTSNTILTDNYIRNLTIDNNDNIWINANNKLYRFDVNNNTWKDFSQDNSIFQNTSIGKVFIDNNNDLFITASDKFYKYENGEWTLLFDLYDITNVNSYFYYNSYYHPVDKINDTFWFSTGAGLFKYENDSNWCFYNTSNSNITDNSVRYIYIDNNNKKWIETDSGIEMFDDENWYLFNNYYKLFYENNLLLSASHIHYSLTFAYENSFWVPFLSNYDDKLSYFNYAKFDKDDYLWLSTGSSIYKIKEEALSSF